MQPSQGGTLGVYGTKGTASPANFPGSRDFATAWIDRSGNLWFFGGYGPDSVGTFGELNDLWEYTPSTNQWTWVAGSNVNPGTGAGPIYGVFGTPAPDNTPGARVLPAGWTDAHGNLWLFGGFGFAISFEGNLNDLWKFDVSTREWAWMGGDGSPSNSTQGDAGVYGTLGIPAGTNMPGSRGGSSVWIDSNGNLLLFGGQGLDANGILGNLNDVWQFNISQNEWTWIGGSNTVGQAGMGPPGVYGTLGSAAFTNTPGGRSGASASTGNILWLFGGGGQDAGGLYGLENDLWKYVPPTSLPGISLPSGTYDGSQSVTITDLAANATIYYTTDGSTPTTASTMYSGAISLSRSCTLQAIAVAPGYTPSAAASATYTITRATPSIALTSSPSIAFVQNGVTFTATLASSVGTPTGIVNFMDGSTPIGAGALNSSGVATFTTPTLAAGSHSITAAYTADTHFIGVTSTAVTVLIEDFTFAPSSGGSTTATVSPGGSATYNLTITPPTGNMSASAITLSVSGLPTGATGTFNPSTVPAGSGPTNVTLTVNVSATAALHRDRPLSNWDLPLCFGLILLPLSGLRRFRSSLHKYGLLVAVGFAGAIVFTALTGCSGGSSSSTSNTPPQPHTYALTVTATAGSLSHTTPLTLTVQ